MGGSNDALPMDLANPTPAKSGSGSWQEILSSSDINVIMQESIKGKKSYWVVSCQCP
ncbi:MAG: hypothetical protein V8S95_13925 [Odoribacter sp.]